MTRATGCSIRDRAAPSLPEVSVVPPEMWAAIPPLLIVAGLVGIVLPVVPGTLLVLAGVLVFALRESSTTGWVIFGASLAVAATGWALQYLVPGRRMRREGVTTATLWCAVGCAVVGFFVIPVVGAIVGFIVGIYLVEFLRERDAAQAWRRTRKAAVAVAQSIGIELAAGLMVAGLYVVGLILTWPPG
jgi:uncharacterized protein